MYPAGRKPRRKSKEHEKGVCKVKKKEAEVYSKKKYTTVLTVSIVGFAISFLMLLIAAILQENGVDSYISRVAATIYGSSETIFYISAVYFSACKNKPKLLPVLIVLVSNFISVVFACFICHVL